MARMMVSLKTLFSLMHPWSKEKVMPMIESDSHAWRWSKHHVKHDYKSVCACHRPENHDPRKNWHKKTHRYPKPLDTNLTPKIDRKLTLGKDTSASLLIISTFAEDQADNVVK